MLREIAAVVVVACTLVASTDVALDENEKEVTILDTLLYDDDNSDAWAIYPDSSSAEKTWSIASWYDPVTSKPYLGFSVCSIGQNNVADNWLRSPYIDIPGVDTVYVNISFFMRDCEEYTEQLFRCRTQFQVLSFETDINYATAETPSWNDETYTSVQTIPADYTYTSSDDPDPRVNFKSFSFSKNKKGFYLAIRDTGMCGYIKSIQVYYRRCPGTVIRHTRLSQVPANTGIVPAYGQCVENAVEADSTQRLQFLCTHQGNWYNPSNNKGCVCKEGYQPSGDACIACLAETFKSNAGNTNCSPCPGNSRAEGRGQAICECNQGFYRAVDENPSNACTEPASAPRDLSVETLTSDSVTIVWVAPSYLGGRSDLNYRVFCQKCRSVIYSPSEDRTNATYVTVTNLVPDSQYTVTIFAENGVSSQAGSIANSDSVSFKTREDGTPSPDLIRKVEAGTNTLTVSWIAVRGAVAYDVVYSPVSDPSDEHTVRVLENQLTLEDLKDATAYQVKVEYFNAKDQRIRVSDKLVLETKKSDSPVTMIAVAIVAVVVCMAIVIVIVVMFLRRSGDTPTGCVVLHKQLLGIFRSKQQCNEKPSSDCEALGPYTNVPYHIPIAPEPASVEDNCGTLTLPLFPANQLAVKTYVDPHTYEDPRQAVREFTKEINASYIIIESVIGGGEFGDVCRGKLRVPTKAEMTVAIKTLKPGASEKSRLDFLTEASIMGQFEDPNVIFLEGVVTKSNPIMIVTEYMENGSLDTFLRANDGKLLALQLTEMLRGIASGMKYLSEMSYIHRDLAARNILVNENLVCKVADFGLSREVEYDTSEGAYTTRGGKIPVRWTAPEAIAYRKFTSSSDVWSFGVVMWEVMSYGERPYWNWSNQDVIKAVDRNYRLPPPMDCPEALHQLMLDCWQKDRKNRPKFSSCCLTLDRMMHSPDLLQKLAKPQSAMLDSDTPDVSRHTTVSEWLQAIKMDRYTDAFMQAGYHSIEKVAQITFADLLEMGVTLIGHQKKIMSSVQTIRTFIEGSDSPIHVSEGFLV